MAILTTTADSLDLIAITEDLGDMSIGEVTPNDEPNASEIVIEIENSGGIVITALGDFVVDLESESASGRISELIFTNGQDDLFTVQQVTDMDIGDLFEFETGLAFLEEVFRAADEMTGTSLDDILAGADGKDRIFGEAGNDQIEGNDGKDKLFGGDGNDELFGNEGKDKLFGEDGDDILDGGKDNDKLKGGSGDDEMGGGDGNDKLIGSDGEDVLDGGDGDDKLKGGNDDDQIYGDTGRDKLIGGAGSDTFIFADVLESGPDKQSRDIIKDFAAEDVLDFSEFDGNILEDGIDALRFSEDGFIQDETGIMTYNNGKLLVDLDGDTNADFQVFINTRIDLTEDNFIGIELFGG